MSQDLPRDIASAFAARNTGREVALIEASPAIDEAEAATGPKRGRAALLAGCAVIALAAAGSAGFIWRQAAGGAVAAVSDQSETQVEKVAVVQAPAAAVAKDDLAVGELSGLKTAVAELKSATGHAEETVKSEIVSLRNELSATKAAWSEEVKALRALRAEPTPFAEDPRIATFDERIGKLERAADDRPVASISRPVPVPEAKLALANLARPADVVTKTTVVKNWNVREVAGGVALLETRQGVFEVKAGMKAPGIGMVRSIERRAGSWVVVADAGVILAR